METLACKPDWEETKARYTAWWKHEYFGRCGLWVEAPLDHPPDLPEPPRHTSIRQKWYDLEHIDRWNQYHMARTFYGGEAVPHWHPGYPGNNGVTVLMGAEVELDEDTGWSRGEPLLVRDFDFRRLGIHLNHPAWLWTEDMLRFACRRSAGKCLVSMGAFGGCGDTLAALRGSQQLLLDCIDQPHWVREADLYFMDMWCEHFERLYALVHTHNEGSTGWFPLWAPGKFYCSHNDFSYMIGPDMFRDLFIPSLRRQMDYLDYSVYHVDGIGAFAHVDALCEIERLQTIQILPGEGKPSPLHYLDVLKKVQRAGKNLHIGIPPEEVRPALEQLSARGLFIHTWCGGETDARRMLADAERWSVDRG